ncbi:S-methyl-5-thioribose-1-phosphate isomerase [Aureibacillus halotolerans]|uniref:Methylthioribose-1-phosphate isomerase n=1 Tax=Aureibacillus halotolerans TaxID=1508390 RepID=A0A4R6U0I9_9BACI|nr:S-methyl-5-thioribose-1-phosphate isomerase [Aureibacillus halotolerans]TDQ39790.1 methylthioribose-1-phosphate isomerase [Aureibacillus halotolerans]
MITAVTYNDGVVTLLDQRKLPGDSVFLKLTTVEEIKAAILSLSVRGAPAIGIAAAYGLVLWAQSNRKEQDLNVFKQSLITEANGLKATRPTAVNLAWAVDRLLRVSDTAASVDGAVETLTQEAQKIDEEDLLICKTIGEHGLTLLKDGDTLLTHCNAGGIATAGYGTALAPFYLARERNMTLHAYATETRPVGQGARLTVWELEQLGIDVTLITDSMAAHTLQSGRIQAVIVGADRIAANGDTANKIGTLSLAVAAKAFGVPFYVAAPLSTIDVHTATGADIPIEERAAEEVTHVHGRIITTETVRVYNPAFDVTPHQYIDGIITEKGVIRGDYQTNLSALFHPAASH